MKLSCYKKVDRAYKPNKDRHNFNSYQDNNKLVYSQTGTSQAASFLNKKYYTMKIICISPVILLVFATCCQLHAQTVGKTLTLNGGSTEYIAREWIDMKDGDYTLGFEGEVDKFVLLDIDDYLTEQPDPDRELNYGLPVGSMPGTFNVTPTGAATYTMPIEVPPGTAGVQPSISIVYNSQGNNGILGYGWYISGLSAITRVPKNIYNDETSGGINLDDNDRFALNGNRLLCISGTYGDAGSVYRTEIETFVKVTAYETAGTGPSYFKVQTKDGSILEYGNTPSSKVEATGSETVLNWQLNKATDANGNYIEYDYGELNGESYIKQIKYTGNTDASITPYNEVNFYHEIRDDKNTVYVSGSQVPQTLVLRKIGVRCQGVTIREYTFAYTLDSYSHLSEIKEYGRDGSQLNSTIVNWGTRTPSLQTYTPVFYPDENVVGTGDFNGDGQTDYVAYHEDQGESPYFRFYLANEDGTSFTPGFYSSLIGEDYYLNFYITDLNGDAKDDLIIRFINPYDEFSYLFYVSSPSGHIEKDDDLKSSTYPQIFITGDFTGNGVSECVVADYYSHSWYMYSYVDDGIFLIDEGSNINWFYNTYSQKKNIPINYNGNGKQDIIQLDNYHYELIEYDGTTFVQISEGHDFEKDDILTWGDFNGDGYTDFYYNQGSGGVIKYSNGTGFINVDCSLFDSFRPQSNNYYSMDMNGDGLMDLVVIGKGTELGGPLNIYVALSMGTSFSSYSTYTLPELEIANTNNKFGDFNGDGNVEYMYDDDTIIKIFDIYQGKANMLVQSVTNGLNLKTSFTYTPMTNDNVYTKGTASSFPVCDVQYPVYLVSSVSGNNGIGGNNTINYTYQGARFHRQGKGYLGLSQFTASNTTAGIKTIHNYGYNPTYFNIFLISSETHTISGNELISSTTLTNAVKVLDATAKRIFPCASPVLVLDNLTNTTVATYYTYDNDGNATNITTNQGGDVLTTVDNVYEQYGGWGPKNRITRSTVTKKYTGEDPYILITDYDYDTDGKLTQQITDPGEAKAVTQTYGYSTTSCGLPLSIITSATDIETRTNSITYDSKYRLPITKTNALDHTVSYKYDYGLGLVTNETDVNGNTTTYTYDGFGMLKTTKLPTGKIINSACGWVTDNTPENARYQITSSSTGSPTSTTYHDLLGRELRNRTIGFEGSLIYTDRAYYSDGNLEKVSNLYKSGNPMLWTIYTYDDYKRPDLVTTPTCSMDYEYSGKTVTITECNGHSTSKTMNSAGDIVTAMDDGGTITYKYHSSGQPVEITAAGATTTMSYDEYGMQESLTDPDAGTITYSYNPLGELLTQTDAKSQTTNMAYDKLGRVKTRITPEGTVTYTYDNATNGKGMLSSVTGYDNTVTFTYDGYSRVSTKTNIIDGTEYPEMYTYNNTYNAISQVNYPTGFSIKNEYDSYGYLKRVKRGDNSALIWECTGVNRYGQVTGATLGNSLTITRTYDQYGFPSIIQTSTVQNMAFSFDPATGNLTWRKDFLPGRNFAEYFAYDDLDRLTNFQIGASNYGITYYDNGNIETKHDAGTYTYDVSRLHAVSQLDNSPITDPDQIIDYNSAHQPISITQEDKNFSISYGVDEQRVKSVYTDNSTKWTRIYTGNYEEEWQDGQITKRIHYIAGGDGLAAVYISDEDGAGEMYYVSKDYLGNILVLTRQNGMVAEEYSYDAWGRRRSPTDWNNYNVAAPTILYRGYTGHEHLDEFALINMNGRVYDPTLGKFLSPDNFVQALYYTQAFNRYSYGLNNPLKYFDPDGEFAFLLVAAIVVGAGIGGYTGYKIGKAYGAKGWEMFGYIAGGAVIGGVAGFAGATFATAIAGAAGTGVSAFEAGIISSFMGGFVAGSINGFGMTLLAGGTFDQAFSAGVSGAFMGGAVGAAGYAIMSGLSPVVNGIGKSLVRGRGNFTANVSRWGNPTIGSLELSSSQGFRYIAGNGIHTNFIHNAAMVTCGTLGGNWGSKRIPAGHWVESAHVTEEVCNLSNRSQISESSLTAQDLREYGIISKGISQAYLFYAYANPYDAFGISSGIIELSSSTSLIPSNGVGWTNNINVSSNNYKRIAILTSLSKVNVTHNLKGKFYESYAVKNPWWRKTFFGIGGP